MKIQNNDASLLILLQAGLLVVLSLVGLISGTWVQAYSLILGASCAFLPNVYFYWYFFRYSRPSNPSLMVKRFYIAEVVKLALTILFLTLSLAFLKLKILLFLSGFIALLLGIYLLPCIRKIIVKIGIFYA